MRPVVIRSRVLSAQDHHFARAPCHNPVLLAGDRIVEQLVEQAFQEADKDLDEKITLDEFTTFVKKHPKLTSWFDVLSV